MGQSEKGGQVEAVEFSLLTAGSFVSTRNWAERRASPLILAPFPPLASWITIEVNSPESLKPPLCKRTGLSGKRS